MVYHTDFFHPNAKGYEQMANRYIESNRKMWIIRTVGWEIGYVGSDLVNRWKIGFFLLAGLVAAVVAYVIYINWGLRNPIPLPAAKKHQDQGII